MGRVGRERMEERYRVDRKYLAARPSNGAVVHSILPKPDPRERRRRALPWHEEAAHDVSQVPLATEFHARIMYVSGLPINVVQLPKLSDEAALIAATAPGNNSSQFI